MSCLEPQHSNALQPLSLCLSLSVSVYISISLDLSVSVYISFSLSLSVCVSGDRPRLQEGTARTIHRRNVRCVCVCVCCVLCESVRCADYLHVKTQRRHSRRRQFSGPDACVCARLLRMHVRVCCMGVSSVCVCMCVLCLLSPDKENSIAARESMVWRRCECAG